MHLPYIKQSENKQGIFGTGIFGILLQTLTQLVAQIQEENENSDDNNTHHGNNNNKPIKLKQTFRRHSTDLPHVMENDRPTEVYVDPN